MRLIRSLGRLRYFRGVVDPAEYKNYVLVMLFLKYLSDVWKDKLDAARKEFGRNEERINRRMSRERFRLSDNCTFDYLYARRSEPNIGELINIALEHI